MEWELALGCESQWRDLVEIWSQVDGQDLPPPTWGLPERRLRPVEADADQWKGCEMEQPLIAPLLLAEFCIASIQHTIVSIVCMVCFHVQLRYILLELNYAIT